MTIYVQHIDENSVTITKTEYNKLIESKNKLDALVAFGVDNWQGYSDAMEYYGKTYGQENDE
jgi:hypothetical protein